MIKQVDITESFNADNLFLIKIKANSLCYKNYDFCKTFSEEENGKTTAYINILSGNATVYLSENASKQEIRSFLLFYGVKNVFCNRPFSLKNKGIILKHDTKTDCEQSLYKTVCPDYTSAYSLLQSEFKMPDYNEFVSDLSFRLSKGFARLIQTGEGVVFTLWETKTQAIISAIAVEKSRRKSGIGSLLLKSIIADLKQENKEIFVYCEEETQDFYIKNGFLPSGNYFTGELI